MICEKCSVEYGVGYSPWCKDGHAAVRPGRGPDITYPGGLTLENLGHEPVTVWSESERQRIMKARGLREMVRHVPVPGTDKSPHTTNWAGPAPHTLATLGAWLEARMGTGTAEPEGRPKVDGPARAEWLPARGVPGVVATGED